MSSPPNIVAESLPTAEPRLSLEQAQQVAKEVSEISVRLVSLLGHRAPPARLQRLNFTLDTSGAEWLKTAPDQVLLVFNFNLAVQSTDDTESQSEVARMVLTYHVVYLLSRPLENWSDETVQSFLAFNGASHVWPYARAEIQELTVKIGLPPLTLPILKPGQLPAAFNIKQLSAHADD